MAWSHCVYVVSRQCLVSIDMAVTEAENAKYDKPHTCQESTHPPVGTTLNMQNCLHFKTNDSNFVR